MRHVKLDDSCSYCRRLINTQIQSNGNTINKYYTHFNIFTPRFTDVHGSGQLMSPNWLKPKFNIFFLVRIQSEPTRSNLSWFGSGDRFQFLDPRIQSDDVELLLLSFNWVSVQYCPLSHFCCVGLLPHSHSVASCTAAVKHLGRAISRRQFRIPSRQRSSVAP